MRDENYSPERIADRMEIQDRLMQFSRGVDRKDWDLALSVFHDGAMDHHGIFSGAAPDFIAFARQRHETVTMSMHHLPNILIEFLGPDTALVETYIFAWQALSPDNKDMRAIMASQGEQSDRPIETIMVSRYVDHFERKAGRWGIQERHVVYEAGMKVTADAAGPDVSGVMDLGRRDEEDMLYRLRDKLHAQMGRP